ncbi:MAG: hypothetical protein JWO32_2717, partial [Bacteroidetes bacterium]|nr:hypothetical protein [Bacteroidota bacterium]
KSVNADFDPGPATYSMAAPNSNEDVFIIKLDPQGNLVWVRQMTGPNNQTGFGLNIDKLGNLITTGLFQGISDFNPPSATYTMSPHNSLNNDYEIFIHKIDSAGQFIWAKQIGGSDFSRGTSVTVDSLNNILTTGYIVGTADFDPGPAVYNLTSAGGTDVFLSRLDPNGNFICASVFGGPGYDEAYSIQNTKTGNIYVAGIFKVVADFDPGPGVHNISSNGSDDLFIAKYNSCFLTVGEKEITHNPFFSLYPNPANGFITLLNGTNVPAKTEVTLFNSLGEKIFQSTILEKNSFTIDVKEYQRGIYFMEAKNSSERMVTKIILE